MTHRVSAGGSFRLDKIYPAPVGRIALATGATTKDRYKNVVACLDRLAERGRLDVLAALKARHVTVAQVLYADRAGQLDQLLDSLTPNAEAAPLWSAVDKWLGPKVSRGHTVKRYGASFVKLKKFDVLGAEAPVSALASLDWRALGQRWTGPSCSGSDWNQMRRAVSRFLTCHLGDEYHPLRRAVVKAIPIRAEVERVPDIDVALFWRIVEAAPEHVRAAFVAITVLGLRVGEYLRLRETDLHPITKTVSIPGTKTKGSSAVLAVAAELWPWLVRSVPAPVGYDCLRGHWKAALKAVGADRTLRMHDLRHLTAQLLVNAGQTEASVQSTMRHATASMTRRYAMQKDRGENAATLAKVLMGTRTA